MGNYTPEMSISATSGGETITGTLSTNAGELSVQPLSIQSVAIVGLPGNTISAGDTIQTVQMLVKNNSPFTIRNISDSLIFNPPGLFTRIANPTNPDSILGGEQVAFQYSVVVPIGALGGYTMDGYVSGDLGVGNDFVFDDEAALTDSFTVISGAIVTLVSYTPKAVSQTQPITFEVVVNNAGSANVLLNQSQTTFEFGGQSFNLNGNQVISASGNSNLIFSEQAITLGTGFYEGTLSLVGTENGASFRDTLLTGASDSLEVQSVAELTLASMMLRPESPQQTASSGLIIRRIHWRFPPARVFH
jgi:hypothetical protein